MEKTKYFIIALTPTPQPTVHKQGQNKMPTALRKHQNYIHQFPYKDNVRNPRKYHADPRLSAIHSMNITVLVCNITDDIFCLYIFGSEQ